MRGCPHFAFQFPITLPRICSFFPIDITFAKIPTYWKAPSLTSRKQIGVLIRLCILFDLRWQEYGTVVYVLRGLKCENEKKKPEREES